MELSETPRKAGTLHVRSGDLYQAVDLDAMRRLPRESAVIVDGELFWLHQRLGRVATINFDRYYDLTSDDPLAHVRPAGYTATVEYVDP